MLPIKLKSEPLIDAIFEFRFTGEQSAAEIIPGLLFNKLVGDVVVERMPVSEIPRSMREQDPNLRYAPLVKLDWGHYFISIGDGMISVGSRLPYKGWEESFKPAIFTVLKCLKSFEAVKKVTRYSVKYVNIIEADSLEEQHKKIKLKISLGNDELKREQFSLKVERHNEPMIHIISVLAGATASIAGFKEKKGVVIDIDSVVKTKEKPFNTWLEGLVDEIELVRNANKKAFFECITDEALKEMGPSYE